jgi:MFS family permease
MVLAIPETVEISVQPLLRDGGLPVGWFGLLYTGLLFAGAIGSYCADIVRRRLGVATWFTIASCVFTGALGVAVYVPTLAALPTFVLGRSINSLTATLGSAVVNDRLDSVGRATALSTVSMIYALLFVCSRAVGGIVADITAPFIAMAGYGAVAILVMMFIRFIADPFEAG